jgi:hypothetical protein
MCLPDRGGTRFKAWKLRHDDVPLFKKSATSKLSLKSCDHP